MSFITQQTSIELRLDKWLWAARFFKTRQLAQEAISGGKVQVNQQRSKPSKKIKIGDQLQISKQQYRWEITVVELNDQRQSAVIARTLYLENPESIVKRQQQLILRREQKEYSSYSTKPNKKQRRVIHYFKQINTHYESES
ncbi:MAG: hypothetical protein RL637_1422 [Pseudomonadota bacterium]|jgi:ribosome-associated heat shock protein Hsp15